MKRLSILALALVFAAGCGSKSPTSASNANEVKFTGTLLPTNEVPPIVAPNVDANAKGTLEFTLELTKDAAGTITAATGDFTFDLTGFPAGTTLTGAHIHKNVAGLNAGVLINLGLGVGEIVLVNGAQKVSKNEINIAAADAADIIANPANYYFNVHTTVNGTGAIRTQLVKS